MKLFFLVIFASFTISSCQQEARKVDLAPACDPMKDPKCRKSTDGTGRKSDPSDSDSEDDESTDEGDGDPLKPEAEPKTEPESKPEPKPEPETKPESKPEPTPEPESKPEPETKPAEPTPDTSDGVAKELGLKVQVTEKGLLRLEFANKDRKKFSKIVASISGNSKESSDLTKITQTTVPLLEVKLGLNLEFKFEDKFQCTGSVELGNPGKISDLISITTKCK